METDDSEKVIFEKIYLEIRTEDYKKSTINTTLGNPEIEQLKSPTYEQYRSWHDKVGEPYGWHERPRINNREAIESLLANPKVQMFILKDGLSEIGYALIEKDAPAQVEISDFGFPPNKVSHGSGSVYFPMLLEQIFSEDIERVWLSTRSTNDPRVVSFYEKFGLKVYKRENIQEFKA